jgi:hypothetical protein
LTLHISPERKSHHILSYHQQPVSDLNNMDFPDRLSHYILSYGEQFVSYIAHFVTVTLHPSYNQQYVRMMQIFLRGCFKTSFPIGQQKVSDFAHFLKGYGLINYVL